MTENGREKKPNNNKQTNRNTSETRNTVLSVKILAASCCRLIAAGNKNDVNK